MPPAPELPACPEGRSGWPWERGAQGLPARQADGRAWPKISIVTPNFNYGRYLEETIRSVLLQAYPNLEYIVIDGGSTDGSVDIIRKYEAWIAHWESEQDRGQAHAINKGFARATGDLLMWINSDDLLLPGALWDIAAAYDGANETLIVADVVNFSEDGSEERMVQRGIKLENFAGIPEKGFVWHQPGIIVPRSFYAAVGGLDEALHYVFDWDWMCRLLIHRPRVAYLHVFVARFRVHDASKTGPGLLQCWLEVPSVVRRYGSSLSEASVRKAAAFYRLRAASLFFGEHPGSGHYWNRWRGIGALMHAVGEDAAVILDRHFMHLLIRALLPRALYRTKVDDA